MWAITYFLKAMAPFAAMTAPIYILIRFIILKRRKQKINWYHEFGLFVFILFLAGLASQTVIPRVFFSGEGVTLSFRGVHETRLQPFRVLEYTYREFVEDHNAYSLLINLLGNIVMFVPIGLFLPLLWRKTGRFSVLAGFVISLSIELIQLFLPRWTDIDDLILNTLGGACGFLIYKILHKMAGGFMDKFSQIPETQSD